MNPTPSSLRDPLQRKNCFLFFGHLSPGSLLSWASSFSKAKGHNYTTVGTPRFVHVFGCPKYAFRIKRAKRISGEKGP